MEKKPVPQPTESEAIVVAQREDSSSGIPQAPPVPLPVDLAGDDQPLALPVAVPLMPPLLAPVPGAAGHAKFPSTPENEDPMFKLPPRHPEAS